MSSVSAALPAVALTRDGDPYPRMKAPFAALRRTSGLSCVLKGSKPLWRAFQGNLRSGMELALRLAKRTARTGATSFTSCPLLAQARWERSWAANEAKKQGIS